MPNFIICRKAENSAETWIDYAEIAAIEEFTENDASRSKIILKSGASVIVTDTAEEIHECILKYEDDSLGLYVGQP